MDISKSYEEIKNMVNHLEKDVDKVNNGNKAAATRVRVKLQEVKNLSQDLRMKILDKVKSGS